MILSETFQGELYLHLVAVAALAVYRTIRGFISDDAPDFGPLKWYPLLLAMASGVVTTLTWHCFIRCSPTRAMKVVFWLGALVTLAVGILFVLFQLASSLGISTVAILLSIAQLFYNSRVKTRMSYAIKIMSISTAVCQACTMPETLLALVAATLYSSLPVSGIRGATTIETHWDILFVSIMILSLTWMLHTVKNMLQTTVAQ